MNQTSSIPYQLGTALLSGQPSVVLCYQQRCFNLQGLFSHRNVRERLALEKEPSPLSLLRMLDEWPYWQEALAQLVVELAHSDGDLLESLKDGELRWLPPIMYPRKLICMGANYSDHITEMGNKTRPRYPYSFLKPATTTLIGSGETVHLPEQAKMVDWEAELAVVIGHRARHVRGEDALACIAGYSILNDISARDWIADAPALGIDWVMQKAFDGFAPMGPFLTSAAFVPDPQRLAIELRINGEIRQHSTTANMIFSVQEIIEHLTSIMTLEPGDVIATGTPAGVGHGRKPPLYLQSGDSMEAEIEGLGVLETPVQ
jgi:2-keto-4-pentenoate hydratase/2-oxohepta-3-ene-1,7-dioic acid hydratase in catechol pathway